MKKNVGSADVFIRTTLGLLAFLIGYYYHRGQDAGGIPVWS